MLNALLSRWAHSRASQAALDAPTTLAHPNDPPYKAAVNDSLWQTLRRRPAGAEMPGQQLHAACAAFETSLDGLQGEAIDTLRQRIRRSLSLGDLWHLRGGLFTALARAYSQRDAERQLALLHHHFAALQGPQAQPPR